MKRVFSAFCLLVFVSLESWAATPTDSTVLPPDDFVPGWSKSDTFLQFSKNNLYGYIDGGAELFLEFGFDELLVQRYTRNEAELVLEVYRMTCVEAALGIYLMKCGEETPIAGITARNSGNRYQFTVVQGRYFLLVNNFAADTTLIPVMVALTEDFLASVPESKPVELFKRLPKDGLIPGSERIIRGLYALQPIFTFGEGDVWQLGGKVFGVVGDYRDTNDNVHTRLVIAYPEAKDALSAYRNVLANLDPYITVVDRVERGFTFQDYRSKYGIVQIKEPVIDIRLGLVKQPTPSINKD